MYTINLNTFLTLGLLYALMNIKPVISNVASTLASSTPISSATTSISKQHNANYVGQNIDSSERKEPTTIFLRNHRTDASAEIDSPCGGTFRGRQTTIESPQFPHDYPPNVHCEYLFISPFMCRNEFHFQFLAFSLESSPNCVKDNVTIDEEDVLCGKVIGIMRYTADRGVLRITFSSDAHDESSGFRLVITRLPCVTEMGSGTNNDMNYGYGIVGIGINGWTNSTHTSSNGVQFNEVPKIESTLSTNVGYSPPMNNGYPPYFGTIPISPQHPGQYPILAPPDNANDIPFIPNLYYYPQHQPGLFPPPFDPYNPVYNTANCPQPNQHPTHFPTNTQPHIPVTDTPAFNGQQYPVKTDVTIPHSVPPTNQASIARCCLNNFNERRFFLVSPGFPNVQPTINEDCLYYIERNNPGICRLRIEFKYYLIGPTDSRFGCFDNFIEVDGRRICGCNTGLVYTSQWGVGPKIIRFVRNNNVPYYGVKGFILDVIQEECPYRLIEDNRKSLAELSSSQQMSSVDSSTGFSANRHVPNIEFGINGGRNIEKANARFFYPNTAGLYGGRCIFNYAQWLSLAANQFWLSKPVCLRSRIII